MTADSPAAIATESSPERSDPAAPAAATLADPAPKAGDLPPPAPETETVETDLLAPLPEKLPPAPETAPAPEDDLPDADAPRMAEDGAEDTATAPAAEVTPPPTAAPAGNPPPPASETLAPETIAPDTPAPDTPAKPRILTPDAADSLPGIAANDAPLDPAAPAANALPQIGATPDADIAVPETMPADILPDDLPPIAAFARPFDNAEAKPLFAILLVDDGTPALDRKALAELPFPVTFVVDPNAPNAAEAAAIYRSGLQEVVMAATGLPADAKAEDVEQSLGANAASLPETVAVIDLYKGGFQDDRALASAIIPILQDQGRGLITYDHGLNAADQVARRDALPAAKVFRVLDAENESAPTMRRYLDRAAFKAAQEGSVVVIGQAMPDTVAAILEWSVEGRAASVALAPITAVLSAP